MTTRRRATICAAAASSWLLAACAPAPVPAPAVVAPTPQAYSCAQQRQAASEFDALPGTAVLRVFVRDYGSLRRQLRAVLGLPEPAPCPD